MELPEQHNKNSMNKSLFECLITQNKMQLRRKKKVRIRKIILRLIRTKKRANKYLNSAIRHPKRGFGPDTLLKCGKNPYFFKASLNKKTTTIYINNANKAKPKVS